MDILNILVNVAKKAGSAIADMQGKDVDERYKAAGDLVTNADRLSHTIIESELREHFPHIPLVLEEQADRTVPAEPFIAGDELDGTVLFARGMSEWSVSLAYVESKPIHGVIYFPLLDILITGSRQRGCRINDRHARINPGPGLKDSVWATELNPHVSDEYHHRYIRPISQQALSTRCLASATAAALELLLGRTHLYINCTGGKIWDFAAGVLCIEEAGGIAQRIDGSDITWDSIEMDVLMASDKKLADEALRLSRE